MGFPTLVRKDSNVFVKKPLPNQNEEIGETTILRHLLRNQSTSLTYESFDCESSVTSSRSLERHMSLTDLVLVGIGSTIGSGLFVLCGLVANQYAGPASIFSWAISGMAALVSGTCYAELSSRIPLSGSAYAYTFVAMGELPAVIAAACLSIEYIAASSAVARSWGDKIIAWLAEEVETETRVLSILDPQTSFSPLALVISGISVALLMNGVEGSKSITNFFTKLKVLVVLFMIVYGLFLMQPSNFQPLVPEKFGATGIFRGATATFFGYLGYDEIACLGGEAKNPKKNLPKAIFITIGSVTALYVLAAITLVGMVPYEDISPVSGFPLAFRYRGAAYAAEIAAIGEIVTLPIVVLITIMAQPRLQYALSKDGLLPPIFSEIDDDGNLTKGTLICGTVMVLIATFVPFSHLNDMISCAVLTALSLTDTSLILLWYPSPKERAGLAESAMGVYHGASLLTGILLSHFAFSRMGRIFAIISFITMIACIFILIRRCPKVHTFGERLPPGDVALKPNDYFCTPFMPFLPCFGIFVNYYLISQLELAGITMHLGFLALAIIYYLFYAINHSVANNGGWVQEARIESIASFGQYSIADDDSFG
jgi:APA family basic amino acid/polyamine antiporter